MAPKTDAAIPARDIVRRIITVAPRIQPARFAPPVVIPRMARPANATVMTAVQPENTAQTAPASATPAYTTATEIASTATIPAAVPAASARQPTAQAGSAPIATRSPTGTSAAPGRVTKLAPMAV